MNVIPRDTNPRVLIESVSAVVTQGGGDVNTAARDVSEFDDVVVEIELTSRAGAPVVGDTVTPNLQMQEPANAGAGWVEQQGYRIHELTGAGPTVTASGDRVLGEYVAVSGTIGLPHREARGITFTMTNMRANFTNGLVTVGVSFTFTIRYYGRQRRG